MGSRFLTIAMLLPLILVGSVTASYAQRTESSGGGCDTEDYYMRGDTVVDKPLYNKENDTWYELVSVRNNWPCQYGRDSVFWPVAEQMAYSLTYKGRRGRLAIVDSQQIHEFLAQFRPKIIAWIGLRYWCNYHKAKWVDGRTYKLSDFSAWGKPWNISGIHRVDKNGAPAPTLQCTKNKRTSLFWPVHYWSMDEGFEWNANGQEKGCRLFYVEFPPPSPGSGAKYEAQGGETPTTEPDNAAPANDGG